MNDLGANTRDLRDLGQPHPSEHGLPESQRETRIQRFGSISLWAGATLLAADIITALALTADDWPGWADPVSRQFAGLSVILVGFAATALFTVGGIERLQRQSRALIRRAMGRADTNADIGQANRAAIQQNARAITEAVDTLVDVQKEMAGIRLEVAAVQAQIRKVKDYGKGVSDGWELGRKGVGLDDLDGLAGTDIDELDQYGRRR